MSRDPDLPRWIAQNQRDRERMEAWVNARLDEVDGEEVDCWGEQMNAWSRESTPEREKEFMTWLNADGPEIAEAERGNIEPLKKKYPHLAKFLQRPKQAGRGRRFPKKDEMSAPIHRATYDGGVGRAQNPGHLA